MAAIEFDAPSLALTPQRHGVQYSGGGRSGLSGAVSFQPTSAGMHVAVDDAVNLTPFFSSLPWATSNSYWNTMQYTANDRKAYIDAADAADGWATIVFDPANPSSASLAAQVSPSAVSWMTVGDEYQLMVELADFSGTPPSTATFTLMAGAQRDVLRHKSGSQYSIPIVEGIQRIPVKVFAPTGQKRMLRFEIKNSSITSYWSGKLRLSLWEPNYAGVYLPYSS